MSWTLRLQRWICHHRVHRNLQPRRQDLYDHRCDLLHSERPDQRNLLHLHGDRHQCGGDGPASLHRMRYRHRSPPPTNVTATSYANTQSVVSWTASDANGSPITGYTVTSWRSDLHDRRRHLVHGNRSHQRNQYTFTVTATNAIGTGPPSAPAAPPPRPFRGTDRSHRHRQCQCPVGGVWTAPASTVSSDHQLHGRSPPTPAAGARHLPGRQSSTVDWTRNGDSRKLQGDRGQWLGQRAVVCTPRASRRPRPHLTAPQT